MKKLFRRKTLPLILTVALLVITGAGAAAGTVLAGKVTGVSNIAVSQALLTEAPVWQSPGDINVLLSQGTNSDYMTQQVYKHRLFIHAPNRAFGAAADDNTAFQAAAEIAVGDWVSFNLPLKNASEVSMGATLTLDIPEGLEVEVWRSSLATNINNVVRVSQNSWRIEIAAGAEYDHVDDCLMITLNADDIAAPGYYTITGTLGQISLGTFVPSIFSTRGRIAFGSDRVPGNDDIYVMDADGSHQTRLTFNASSDNYPAWAPLGNKIAFSSNRDGNSEIYVMDADGSNPTRLTENLATDMCPAWSPDGTRIAFTTYRHGNSEIYVMNADGSNPIRLTDNPAADKYPAWSPDGSKIAFGTDRDGGNNDIYVMNADGSNPTRLTTHSEYDGQPSWSPDGSKITFTSGRDLISQVYIMNNDGTNQVRLSDLSENDWASVWSPDGTKIAFTTVGFFGDYEIYVMNADGSGRTNLTNTAPADDNMASW